MKERPILFSGPMVRAILDGRKTQTRRSENRLLTIGYVQPLANGDWEWSPYGSFDHGVIRVNCPYGKIGDRLWVRETWMPDPPRDGTWSSFSWEYDMPIADIPERFRTTDHVIHRASWTGEDMVGWKPSIHMPRWASRITLEVTSVRMERLQEISLEDCKAEGIGPMEICCPAGQHAAQSAIERAYKAAYKLLWNSIYGEGSWAANSWVWVIEFNRLKNP